MWPRWSKISPGNTATTTAAAASPCTASNSSFSFSTLKDVQALLREDEQLATGPHSSSPAARKPSVFHRVRIASSTLRSWRSLLFPRSNPSPPTEGESEKRIVLYYTTLRVVRKTFEDCRAVRSILRGFRVAIDERDLSMDSGFLAELEGILGRKQLILPRVFIGGRYIGGAEEIQHLHESGELKRFVEGVPPAAAAVCQSCGGVRFVLCPSCSGSRKCYAEKGGFRSCTNCNENGLVRCPDCCRPSAV